MKTERRSTRQQRLSRREVLKALAAMGGAAAASALLPEKWIKPVVEAGVVPAHAQASIVCNPPYTIESCEITDYFWSDHNNFNFTTRAYVSPACDGIPLKQTHESRDVNLALIFSFESTVNIITESQGRAVLKIGIDFNHVQSEPYLSSITWKFANPDDGVATCTSTIIYPPRP